MSTVLLTGVGGPAGRSLATQLSARGIRVHGVDMCPTSLPGIGFDLVPPALDASYPGELLGLAERVGADLIIPTVSEELPVVAGLTEPRILVSSLSSVAIAADKWLTCQVLATAGIPVPRSVPADQFGPDLADDIGLPVVTKPRVGRGGRNVTVHDTWFDPESLPGDYLVSEFAAGEEYCPNLFLADDPADDVVVVLRKTGLKSGRHGNATGVERVRQPAIAEVAQAAGRALGLRGPVDIDIRQRTDGTPLVLEINARFGANSAHAPEVLDAVLNSRLAVTA